MAKLAYLDELLDATKTLKKSIKEVSSSVAAKKSAKVSLDAAPDAVTRNTRQTILSNLEASLQQKTRKAIDDFKNYRATFKKSADDVVPANKKSLITTCKENKKTCTAAITALGVSSYVASKSVEIYTKTDGAICNITSITQSFDGNISIDFTLSVESMDKKIELFAPQCSISITASNSIPSLISDSKYTIISVITEGFKGTIIVHAPLFCNTAYKRCENNYVCALPEDPPENKYDSPEKACFIDPISCSTNENPYDGLYTGLCIEKIPASTKLIQDGTTGVFVYNADDTGALVLKATIDTIDDAGTLLGDGMCAFIEGLPLNCTNLSKQTFYIIIGIIGVVFILFLLK